MLASSRVQRLLALTLVALLAAIAALLLTGRADHAATSTASDAPPSALDGPTLPPGLRAKDFALPDQKGRVLTLSGLRGHVVVLTFIHSQCQDACPFMVEQIKGALNLLGAGPRAVPAVGVSVAPGEDTPAHREAFLREHEMEGRLAFLGGSTAALRRVWRAYAIQPVAGRVEHSAFVLLIDRRGFERVGFPADQLTPEALAHDIRVLERQKA